MHVSSELFIVLFISLSYRGDVSLKNHELSWFRCRVHQNVVLLTANLSSACPEQSKTWLMQEISLAILNGPSLNHIYQEINSIHFHIYCLQQLLFHFGLVLFAFSHANIEFRHVTGQ